MRSKSGCTTASRADTTRGAERRLKLRSTAAEMFLNCGYEGVSVDGLISRVGGSRRNVYGSCGGKQGLFIHAVRDMCSEISAQLAALPMADAGAREGLLLYGQRLLTLVLQPRMLAMHRLMIAEGQRFPEQARSLCQTGRGNATAALGQWLAARQAANELRGDVAALDLADLYINLIICGPQVRALVGELPPGWSAEGIAQHVQTTVDLFLRGAHVQPASIPSRHSTFTRKTCP